MIHVKTFLFLFAACSSVPLAQTQEQAKSGSRLAFGVMVGGYTNSDFDSQYIPYPGFPPTINESDSGGYVIGPTLDVRLFSHVSLGVGALYKPLHYRAAATFDQNDRVVGFAPATVVTWQFPILARYQFSSGRVRTFIEGGPSLRSAGNLNSANPSHFGMTAGVGAEMNWHRLNFGPRVRYTRWAEDPLYVVPTRSDQVEFLMGISYSSETDAHPLGRHISVGAVFGWDLRAVSGGYTGSGTNPYTGVPFTYEQISGVRHSELGPLVEMSLTRRFSVEANAISRSMYSKAKTTMSDEVHRYSSTSGLPWEIPVLLKCRLSTGSFRPFVALGPSFRLVKGSVPGASTYGVTAGGGVEFRFKKIRIQPTLRYTRWAPEASPELPTNRVQVVVGLSI